MLEEFLNDPYFPTQTVNIYAYNETFDQSTGVVTKGYAFRESREVWILPQSTAKRVFTDKIVDDLQNVMVTDEIILATDILSYGDTWYQVKLSDDILFSGQVVQIGLIKIKRPDEISGEVEGVEILGDGGGVI